MFGPYGIYDGMGPGGFYGNGNASFPKNDCPPPKSDKIVSLSFSAHGCFLSCEKLSEGGVRITASGGNFSARDGTAFQLNFITYDAGFLDSLQKVITEHRLYSSNGFSEYVPGLSGELGDSFAAKYESGEEIHTSSNRTATVPDEAAKSFYALFRSEAQNCGFDFTTAGSNVKIYDDADEEYLQGTWRGKHFGWDCSAVFEGNRIKFFYDGMLTDDEEYVVVDGEVCRNLPAPGVTEPKKPKDYAPFCGFSTIKKKNGFTITAYFKKGTYSTGTLLRVREK